MREMDIDMGNHVARAITTSTPDANNIPYWLPIGHRQAGNETRKRIKIISFLFFFIYVFSVFFFKGIMENRNVIQEKEYENERPV